MTALDAATELRNETIKALETVGIGIEYHHHEVAPSQHEIDMRYASALDMADQTITYRLIVKEVAAKNGVYATFMPKPLFGENGSGMHTHMSLFTDGRNQFFDGSDDHNLSAVGKQFIAGLLRHARELAPVFAQWVNSYKRLVPGFEAPVYVAWSQRNRSALIRIPLYKPGSEQATRAEIRCPDPACNPYLTFAALLHAGLEGIEKGYELEEPMDSNLYHLTAEERRERGIVSLPETLGEAIDEFARSDLLRRAFGDHIFDNYVKLKRKEWDDYRVQLTQWELDRYLTVCSFEPTPSPLRVMCARPVGVDPAARHAVQGMARLRVDQAQVEVAEEEEERGVHQPVVDQDRLGEPEARVALAVPEQHAGDAEQHRERSGDDRVQLLAGVQAALWRAAAAEPVAVVAVERVDLVQRRAQAAPVAGDRRRATRATSQATAV